MKSCPDEAANGYAGRLNHVPKVFIEHRDKDGKAWADCHVDDSQAQGISKVALMVARYAGHPDLVQQVTRMVDVLQISPISIESSVLLAKLFERILFKHESPSAAISSLLEDADRVQLTAWQRHVLTFITSDALIGDFVSFAQALNNIPAAADHRRNDVAGPLGYGATKSEEVRRQYADKPELQRRLIDHITKEAETNSFLSLLAVYAPIPLFMALYRSVNSLVAAKAMREPFLWIPDLQGPVYDA
eukprot:gene17459-20068_t